MRIVKSEKSTLTLAAAICDLSAVMPRAVSHLNDYVQSEGFPFHDFEITHVATWYDSRWKEYRFTFRFRWL